MIDAAKAPAVTSNAASRDELLAFVRRPVQSLPGFGPKVAKSLGRLLDKDAPTVRELLALLPRDWLDTHPIDSFATDLGSGTVTIEATISRHDRPTAKGRPHVTRAIANGASIDLVWFGPKLAWVERSLVTGNSYRLHGRLQRFGTRIQLPHPELLPCPEDGRHRLLPVYPLTAGLLQTNLRRVIDRVARSLPDAPEWLPPGLLDEDGWPSWRLAWQWVHGLLLAEADRALLLSTLERARRRLAFDELLALQLALALERARRARRAGRRTLGNRALRDRLLAALPFALTTDQNTATDRIAQDQASPSPMLRLLQGDVGSGKTLVAFMAMLQAVEAGRQAVLLAPTELLCRQHHATLGAWAGALDLEIAMLTGGGRNRARQRTIEALASGRLKLVVGTHALLEQEIGFHDLALAVIDEQHRFGVSQRLALAAKGAAVDLLFLSATPIPRTLLLAAYGDIAVSSLRQKPKGRQPVRTRVVPRRRLAEVVAATGRALARGQQIFWVCPAIAPTEDGTARASIAAAEERFAELQQLFGDKVGLVHGKQAAYAREACMAEFRLGRIRLLVATTVIEVGVDVSTATVMIIESAECFGLSQLHQLRGRVGRGSELSSCLLVYDDRAGPTARERLGVLRHTEDGFAIAEADLRIRGPGELLGQRQSGLPAFTVADLARDQDLLQRARDLARQLLERDPALERPESSALRTLLELHGRQDALPVLGAG